MKTQIKILNGPPGVGKDTIANGIESLGCHKHMRFKDHLYELVLENWGLEGHERWFRYVVNDRGLKEEPHPALTIYSEDLLLEIENSKLPIDLLQTPQGNYCTSPRGALIIESELITKPTFGQKYFGIIAGMSIAEDVISYSFMFSDGGFAGEFEGMVDVLGTEDYEYTICRLHREGFNFSKDSRNYLKEEDLPDCFNFRDIYLEDGDISGGINQLDF